MRLLSIFLLASFVFNASLSAQQIDLTELRDINLLPVDSKELQTEKGYTFLMFVKVCDKKCCHFMEEFDYQNELANENKNIQFVIICEGDQQDFGKLRITQKCFQKEYLMLLDVNGKLSSKLCINDYPMGLLFDNQTDRVHQRKLLNFSSDLAFLEGYRNILASIENLNER